MKEVYAVITQTEYLGEIMDPAEVVKIFETEEKAISFIRELIQKLFDEYGTYGEWAEDYQKSVRMPMDDELQDNEYFLYDVDLGHFIKYQKFTVE